MNTASEVLVIIVSAVLAVFLIILIVAIGYTISILKQVKRITEKAENVAYTVEAAANTFEKAASPLAVLKIISGIVSSANKHKRRG